MSNSVKLGICLLTLLWSCRSYGSRQEGEIRELLASSQFIEAAEKHRNYREHYRNQDELLYQLNQSNLEYYRSSYLRFFRGDLEQPLPYFERAEDLLRYGDAEVTSFSWQVKSQTIQAPYTASLPESLWHNVFGSLYYWNRSSRDGMLVELRRNQEKEQLFKQFEGTELDFYKSALMQYLGMIYYRDSKRNIDDWRINRDALLEVTRQSSYYPRAFSEEKLPGSSFSAQSGMLNFCIFTGSGVRKVAQGIRVIKVPGGLAIQMDNGQDAESELGFSTIVLPNLSDSFSYYQMEIPVMQALENSIERILVRVDGELRRELYPLEPFAEINMTIFRRLRAVFLPEQISAFILKIVASEVLQGAIKEVSDGAALLGALAGSLLVNISAPVPNLRTVDFYPSVAWVGELELSEGQYRIELEYYSRSGLLNQKLFEVTVREGESVIVQDYYAR